MALLFCDGFGHVEDGYGLVKWDYQSYPTIFIYANGYGATGGYGCRVDDTSVQYCIKYLPSSSAVIVGYRLKFNGFNSGATFLELDSVHLRVSAVGEILVYANGALVDTTISGVLHQYAWAYLEIKVFMSATVGTIEVRVNGTTVSDLTDINTGGAEINQLQIHGMGHYYYIDDLYVCDTSGTENNDFLGDITVKTLYPTADGTYSDFTPSTGVDNYATVDEPQLADATDYNESGTVGDKDSYDVTTITGAGDILGVQVTAAVLNADTGTMNVRPFVRSGATPADVEGDDYALSQTMKGAMHIFEKEPTDDVAWDNGKVNAAEFGIKIQS